MDSSAASHQTDTITDVAKDANGTPLFMSYAHEDDDIRKRIYEYLIAKGYDCHYDWESSDGIGTGDDWRARIGQMIEEANGNVIALLSGKSMKENGVCRNELAVALNLKNGRVQPILIAPEDDVDIPPSIVHVQWLDMSDWEERAEDPIDFEEWFEGCMDKLCEALQNPDFYSFNEEITELGKRLEVRQNLSKVFSLLEREFYGREWLTEEVDAWAKDADGSQMKVLTGDPGFGKSAWAAHFAHHKPTLDYKLVIGTFCERGTEELVDPRVVVQTIAFALACRDEAYRKELVGILGDERSLKGNAKDLFKTLLSEPLSNAIDGGHENVIIIIDGLDEAGPADGEANPLAQLLGENWDGLPKWVRLLVTTRDVDPVTKELDKAHHSNGCSYANLNESDNRWDDVESFARQKLQEKYGSDPGFENAVSAIKEKSNGDFLYASLVVDALNSDESDAGLEMVDDLAPGLSGAIRQWFQWMFGSDEDSLDEYDEAYADALGFILVAPNALPLEELSTLLGWRDRKVQRFLRRIRIITRRSEDHFGNEAISLNHDFVKEWLANEDASGDYYVSPKDAIKIMAERFYDKAMEDPENLTPYEKLYTLDLLESAKLTKKYESLRNDAEFVKLAVDLVSDYDRNFSIGLESRSESDRKRSLENLPTITKIGIAQRLLQYIPLPGSFDEESMQELVRERARLLNNLIDFNRKLLRFEDVASYKDELFDLKRHFMRVYPTKETIEGYETAISRCGHILNRGSNSCSDEYENAKRFYIERIGDFENLSVDPSDSIYIQQALLSMYDSLTELALRHHHFDDAEMFASKRVAITETLICNHMLDAGKMRSRQYPCRSYTQLSDVYDKQGNIDKALMVVRTGFSFLEEHLIPQETEEDRSRQDLIRMRYENLSSLYSAMARISQKAEDTQLMRALYGEFLEFENEVIWSLCISPSQKAIELINVLKGFFLIPDISEEEKAQLIERIKPWIDTLQTETDDVSYMVGLQPVPRESFAGLFESLGLHERAIEEYSGVLEHVHMLEVDEKDEPKRNAKVVDLYDAMARNAIKGGCADRALEYNRLAVEEVKHGAIKNDGGLGKSITHVDLRLWHVNVLERANSNLINSLRRTNCVPGACEIAEERAAILKAAYIEACEIAEERVAILEVAYAECGEGLSAKRRLSDAYNILSGCYQDAKMNEEALAASRKNFELCKDGEDALHYMRSLARLMAYCRQAGLWDEVRSLSLEKLIMAEAAAHDDLSRTLRDIIESAVVHADCLLRLEGEDAARVFLAERLDHAPHAYPVIFASNKGRESLKSIMRKIQGGINRGKFDSPEIGCKLISLISEWSGVEVPPTKRQNVKEPA